MAEVQITFTQNNEQGVKILPDYFRIQEEDRIVAEGASTEILTIKISDLLSDFLLELHSEQSVSTFSIYLLPLLVDSSFSLTFFKDLDSLKYFKGVDNEQGVNIELGVNEKGVKGEQGVKDDLGVRVEFRRIFDIDHEVFLNGGQEKKRFEICESLGLDLKVPSIMDDKKYLEGIISGLSSQIVQGEARQISVLIEKNAQIINCKEKPETFNRLIQSLEVSSTIIASQQELIKNLEKAKKCSEEKAEKLANNCKEKDQKIQKLESQVEDLEAKINFYKNLEIINNDLKNQVSLLKLSLDEQQKLRQDLREEYEKAIIDFQASIQSFTNLNESISQDSAIFHKLEESESSIATLQSTISSQSSEIARLNSEIHSLTTDSKFSQLTSNSTILKLSTTDQDSLNSLPQCLKDQMSISSQSQQLNTLLEKLKLTEQKLEESEENCKHQEDIIKLISVNNRISVTQNKLSQIPQFSNDLQKVYEELNYIKKVSSEFERNFYSQSSGFFKKIIKLSDLNLNMHRVVEKFVRIIFDKDCLIYSLRNIARDAALERRVYIPVKSDPIDLCLAEYINNRKTPLQIPLIREDQGVYNFYTRTIKVKIENNRIIVRLGGGFEGLDDFLNANMQAELEKLEERRKFFLSDSVKKLIETDFQVLGLPSVIDHLTPPLSNDISISSTANSSFVQAPSSPKNKKRPSVIMKEASLKSLLRKKTMN